MFSKRITGIINGQIRPIGTEPVFSTASSPWSGFLLEAHALPTQMQSPIWAWHTTHVVLFTAGRALVRLRRGSVETRLLARPGAVILFPTGCNQTQIFWSQGTPQFQSLVAELDPVRIQELVDGRNQNLQVAPVLHVEQYDEQIEAMMRSMYAEARAGCPAGRLFGESLSLALAAYVCGRYLDERARAATVSDQPFSPSQLRCLLDYIDAHLETELSLTELATLVRLSPRHFSRLFRRTFGVAPHQYVVQERINRAKTLLTRGRMPIMQVAATLGFASQSHFTDVFRKCVGQSPRRYQQGD